MLPTSIYTVCPLRCCRSWRLSIFSQPAQFRVLLLSPMFGVLKHQISTACLTYLLVLYFRKFRRNVESCAPCSPSPVRQALLISDLPICLAFFVCHGSRELERRVHLFFVFILVLTSFPRLDFFFHGCPNLDWVQVQARGLHGLGHSRGRGFLHDRHHHRVRAEIETRASSRRFFNFSLPFFLSLFPCSCTHGQAAFLCPPAPLVIWWVSFFFPLSLPPSARRPLNL